MLLYWHFALLILSASFSSEIHRLTERDRQEDGGAPPLATYPIQLLGRMDEVLVHNSLISKSVIFSLHVSL